MDMNRLDARAERQFYIDHLKQAVLPFWLKNGIDRECDGYFTCFTNDGSARTGTDKYTWSQGRMVWLLAELSSMGIFNDAEREGFLADARAGAEFLMKHCRLPGGNCAFLTDRSGKPKTPGGETAFDTSIYADCFVILGLARLAMRGGDAGLLDYSFDLYRNVMARFARGGYPTQPYPEVPGWRTHPMVQLGIAEEMAWALASFERPEAGEIAKAADGFLSETLKSFVTPAFLLHERIRTDGSFGTDSLIGRYVNPGHTIEDLWFMAHQALGIPAGHAMDIRAIQRARPGALEFVQYAAKICKSTFRAGWDEPYGGLLLFADMDGGSPRGGAAGMEHEVMVRKVRNDWQSKLWWPHSEALYTTLLLHRLTGDDELLALYRKTRDYTFRTFPNPDTAVGEWIQIRDRQGLPDSRVVALPVKDPFHIIRNLILIIRLLEGWEF